MRFDPAERLPQILAVPPELLAYERWLQAERRSGPRDYLFSEDRPRFEPRKEDVVAAVAGLRAAEKRGKTHLIADGIDVELEGVARRDAQRFIGAIDGTRTLLEVRWQSGVSHEALACFLRATFGRVVMAPQAIAALEAQLAGVEITRFPGAPYTIERPYWENMIAVRAHFRDRTHLLGDTRSFIALLRELHVLALLGKTLESFYRPASPIDVVAPGSFYVSAPRVAQTASGPVYLDGPRVHLPLLGGEVYHRLLCASLGPRSDTPALDEEDGIAWGTVVTARSEREAQPVPLFLPPRPIYTHHFEALRADLVRALAGDAAHAARFHQRFVRLHPFHCANQSLAMNLVNATLPCGIPHLVLDHLALRLSSDAYVEVFQRAVDVYAIAEPDPVRRLTALVDRKRRFFGFLEHLARGGSPADDPQSARCALLEPRIGA